MDRFFAAPENWEDETVVLGREESYHCRRVMRKRAGELVVVFDGEGRWATGRIREGAEGEVRIEVESQGESGEGEPVVTLAVAIPKGKTMDLIVQKAVELGAQVVQPLVTENTVVNLKDGAEARKREKWQRVALEACKQCGRNVLPQVKTSSSLADWLVGRQQASLGLLASLAPGVVTMKEALRNLAEGTRAIDLLVGPEGDFTRAESEAALAAGFRAVSFGEVTLRVETAVMYGLSVVAYELRS